MLKLPILAVVLVELLIRVLKLVLDPPATKAGETVELGIPEIGGRTFVDMDVDATYPVFDPMTEPDKLELAVIDTRGLEAEDPVPDVVVMGDWADFETGVIPLEPE